MFLGSGDLLLGTLDDGAQEDEEMEVNAELVHKVGVWAFLAATVIGEVSGHLNLKRSAVDQAKIDQREHDQVVAILRDYRTQIKFLAGNLPRSEQREFRALFPDLDLEQKFTNFENLNKARTDSSATIEDMLELKGNQK